jgi:hypothetical protein
VTCEADDDPQAPIQITGYAWPALMIGELVFTRAGVHVRTGAAHAVPGVADRSVLRWEYWRRHRITSDGSFCWGHNSQWKTELRRDYLTDRGRVYDFDALSEHSRRRRQSEIGDSAEQPLTVDQAEFIKNRYRLCGFDDDEPDFPYLDSGIDERHR